MKGLSNIYEHSAENPKGKRPVKRPMQIWQNNIKNCLKVIEFENVDWINVAEDTILDTFLWTRWRTFKLKKWRGISWLDGHSSQVPCFEHTADISLNGCVRIMELDTEQHVQSEQFDFAAISIAMLAVFMSWFDPLFRWRDAIVQNLPLFCVYLLDQFLYWSLL